MRRVPHPLLRTASWLTALVLLAGLHGPAAASSVDGLAEYARAIGVDRSRAMEILRLEDFGSALEGAIVAADPDWYAGLWIESDSALEIQVYSTDPGAPGLSAIMAGLVGFDADVRVVPVEASLTELVADQQAILNAWRGQDLPFAMEVNVRANRVDVATSRARWNEAGRLASLPTHARFTGVEMVASEAANLYGGFFLSSCTSGFGVRNSQGTEGISTAGHCSNTQSFGGNNLPYVTGKFSGAHDSQWHTSGGHTILDDVKYGGGLVYDVSGRGFRSIQALGTNVCYFGAVEGWDCAHLESKTHTCIGTNPTATCMRLHDDTDDLVDNGDSGGPVYKTTTSGTATAYGLISGCLKAFFESDCSGKNDLIYVATDYVESPLGALVMTSP